MKAILSLGALFLGVLAVHSVSAQEDVFHKREVPYVATPQVTVDEMLRLANVGPQDFDFGDWRPDRKTSFDGRVSGDVIEGELTRGVGAGRSVTRWRAVRVGK